MSKFVRLLACCLGFAATGVVHADPGPMILWYTNAASMWQLEPLPIGNGKLAAMVYGGVATETVQFNEDTIWTGQPHDYYNPAATPANLASMQSTVFSHNSLTTPQKNAHMSVPLRQAHYQPGGVLTLTFPGHSGLINYRRSLDLNTATANVKYDVSSVTYNRDFFASAPSNKVLVVRLTASQAAKVAFTASFSTLQPSGTTFSTVGNDLVMHAKVTSAPRVEYYATGLTNAIYYDARLRVIANGGTVTTTSSSITVTNADDVTLLLAVASNFVNYNDLSADYVNLCSNNIAAAAALGYADLRQGQQADYTNLFNRVVLDLGGTAKTNLNTGARLKRVLEGDDAQLSALYFQMGRYMMIAGSRPGAEPLNLQGKWNDLIVPNWESKMTLNINQFLNYSGAEMANLSECHEPMFGMISDLSVTGAKVARTNYNNARGWVVHHNTDLWRGAAPINGVDGIWPGGGAWLAQNLWWHYQYTGDTNFLANTAYPLMKSAAEFFQDFLIPHPTETNWLVTNPSYSSEHNWKSNAIEVANVAAPTMDNELLRDLFSYLIESTQILGIDAAFRTNLMALRSRIPPDQIGKYGQLQEWLEDVDSQNDAHRHCSHLVGLYPGEQISPYYTPRMAGAAQVSTVWRSVGDIGWGKAWRIGLHARLGNAAFAYHIHTNMLFRDVGTNMMFTDVNNRQVDGIFGSLGSVTEMFLQSQFGELALLPALPQKWTNGSVSGLCGRGGFEVAMQWQSNRLASAIILSKLGNTCRVRSKWPIDVKLGSDYVPASMIYPGVYEFATTAGSSYSILPAGVETEALTVNSVSAGDTHVMLTNLAFSNLRGTRLNANAASDYISYVVPNVTAGTYKVRVVADGGADRGQFQLSVGPVSGSLVDVGSVQDTYSPTNMRFFIATNTFSATTYTSNMLYASYWTNQLVEYDCGTFTVLSTADQEFKFTVAGKNAGSSGYNLSFDFIKLTPDVPSGPNGDPTDLALANASVWENQSSGTTVGSLSSTDPDAGNTFTYTLVSGAGSTDNGSFSISGSNLLTGASFNYEAQNSYSVRVRTTDQGGLFYEEAFTISVLDTNDAPTDIALSANTVAENEPSGTTVGTLSSTDVDSGSFTYTLVSGTGSSGNGSFSIIGDTLQTAASFNYEAQNSYSIRVRSDDGGIGREEIFTINVTDVPENSAPATPVNAAPANGALEQSLTLTLSASAFSDPDLGDTHAASEWLVRDTNSTVILDTGVDTVNKVSLAVPAATLTYATAYNWQVRYQDNQGAWSSYSTQTAFTTLAPTLTVTVLNGSVVLSWPVEAAGFSLVSTTTLAPSSWGPVLPAPNAVGGFNWVTNAADGGAMFYRLIR